MDGTMQNIKEAVSLHFENEDYNEYGYIENSAKSVNVELNEFEYA